MLHRINPPPDDDERQKAVALGYDPDSDESPKVLAKGMGQLAENIIEVAKQNRIPIREDNVLVQSLAALDLEENIPPELYVVVAEVLAYVYRIKQKRV